jgi:hypothetical protein
MAMFAQAILMGVILAKNSFSHLLAGRISASGELATHGCGTTDTLGLLSAFND